MKICVVYMAAKSFTSTMFFLLSNNYWWGFSHPELHNYEYYLNLNFNFKLDNSTLYYLNAHTRMFSWHQRYI